MTAIIGLPHPNDPMQYCPACQRENKHQLYCCLHCHAPLNSNLLKRMREFIRRPLPSKVQCRGCRLQVDKDVLDCPYCARPITQTPFMKLLGYLINEVEPNTHKENMAGGLFLYFLLMLYLMYGAYLNSLMFQ